MSWNQIIGHENVRQRFTTSFDKNRLANTYLFCGRDGIGKRKFALKLAQTLFCETESPEFEPCGNCPACVQVNSLTHPDLILISRPADKNFLPVELFIGDREHRRRTGLCHDINLTPFSGKRKFAIIDDADFFNAESANSLLKILEEPPNNSILVLIGTSEHRQLPTILSRCQVVRFRSLDSDQVASILKDLSFDFNVPQEQLVLACEGSISRAHELNDEELFAFRNDLHRQMATLDPANGNFSKIVCDYVDGFSKEAARKRKRMILIADFAIQLFRDGINMALDSRYKTASDQSIVATLLSENDSDDLMIMLAELIDRTILFQRHVDTNMAMANIVPSWLNDIGAIARREKVVEI